ncbi:6-phosphogluconolactonase [Dactylella cylindrospora]|nr:6-phosphogluconolactonase [Dactylella cylindrospora]
MGHVSKARDTFTYPLSRPGPNKERQEASHPHQVVIDPTGQFVISADLGADLLRLYAINSSRIIELPATPVTPGSGPRHGQFLEFNTVVGREILFYLVNELRNTVAVYSTRYTNRTIEFTKIQELDTLPPTTTHPASLPTPTAGEITISQDQRFLYVSNRNDYSFRNRPSGPSDSIALYEINPHNGLLTFKKLLEAGGITPRHFSIDKSDQYVAIAHQESDSVVVYTRDLVTGEFKLPSGLEVKVQVNGEPVCVQWL